MKLMRQQATQKRLIMAEIAVSIINGQEMLGGLGVLDVPLQERSGSPVEQNGLIYLQP